jgi:hypothetical protein
MRIVSTFFVFFICALLLGCTSGNQVNGRSLKSANRSVNRIKNRLPTEKRIEFEISYWTLRDSIKDKDKFLDTISGKTPEELIILGKEVFQQRKNEGFKTYDEFINWDQMIAKYTQERIDQNKHKKPIRKDNNDSILYNL